MADYGRDYLRSLTLERGLSTNTAESYSVDIGHLMSWLEMRGLELADVRQDHLHELLCDLGEMGLGPASLSRFISGIRGFFRYLKIRGVIERDPSELIEMPKRGRKLPDVLSTEEIDAMIAAIDWNKDEALRNNAIIETLYGSGLRVSELCGLRI